MENKVAVLICAYNEEKHIKKVVSNVLKKIKKVIVVNDGSTDNTLQELKKTKATIITYKKNQGKGFALKEGFEYGIKNKIDYLILMDADGQHNPNEIPKFLKEIKKDYDLIIGCRKKRHSDMPYIRRATNFLTSVIISAKGITYHRDKSSGQRTGRFNYIKDSQSGYRAIKLEFLKNMILKRRKYDLETEMLLKMLKKEAKIKCISIKTIYGDESSTINPIKDTARFFRALKTK